MAVAAAALAYHGLDRFIAMCSKCRQGFDAPGPNVGTEQPMSDLASCTCLHVNSPKQLSFSLFSFIIEPSFLVLPLKMTGGKSVVASSDVMLMPH